MYVYVRKFLAMSLVAGLAFAFPAFAHDGKDRDDRRSDRKLQEDLALAFSGRAKNVILFLGDGMGDAEITAARNYEVGANGRLNMDTLPFTGEYTTYALQEGNPALPNYVTDSAASGTGWATGHKTSNGRISTEFATNKSFVTILELAQAAGYRTGNVSTAEITDATPAVLGSHVNDRGCQGPANMANCPQFRKINGGPGSIAEQLIDHQIDVILGGGKARFDQVTDAGPTVLSYAQTKGYIFVGNAGEMESFSNSGRLLGLFNAGNMTVEWDGAPAAAFPGSGPQTCAETHRPANEPSLAAMTTKALELLARDGNKPLWSGKQSKKGFFLQVEGASIDKQDHASAPCQQIGETIAFDEAIRVGLEFAKHNPETLVVVTADHGHTSQIIEFVPDSEGNSHPGAFSVLTTKEGAQMTINYATAAVGASQQHTGTEVRIAAKGPNAHKVLGISNQTDLFHIMADALGLE